MKFRLFAIGVLVISMENLLCLDLKEFAHNMEKDPFFSAASYSFYAKELKSQKELIAIHENKSLIPRSMHKLVTTAASLHYLGKDFHFSTKLYVKGKIEKGSLKGDVVIKGSGDPSFGSSRFSKDALHAFASDLKKLGIRLVEGNIIADASCFEKAMCVPSWQYEDIGNYYGVGASGLNFHENFYAITFSLGKQVGEKAEIIETSPKVERLHLINEVKCGAEGSGDKAYVFGNEFNYSQVARGTVPLGFKTFTIKAAVPDPAAFCAEKLKAKLIQEGISVLGDFFASYDKKKEDLLFVSEVSSEKLPALLCSTHLASINLYTEALLKKMGEVVYKEGSLEKGLIALKEYMNHLKVADKGFCFADGSGLSTENLISTRGMCDFLEKVRSEPYFSDWKETLNSVEDKNTLKSFFKKVQADQKVFAKTGTSRKDKSVSGYIEKEDSVIVFSIMVNHYLGSSDAFKEKISDFFTLLCAD